MKRWLLALLPLALLAGVAGGLVYAWFLSPAKVHDTDPATLSAGDKLAYLTLVGDLYAFEGDLGRAEARVVRLGLQPDGHVLAAFVEQFLDTGGRPEDVRGLARLAQALGGSGGVLSVFSDPSPSPPATLTPGFAPTATPMPTATPAPTFLLVEQAERCAAPGRPGLITVRVRDAEGEQMAGVQLLVSWTGGQDRFWTGLRPELGDGYADFSMAPDTSYDVSLATLPSEVARGLTSALSPGLCPEGVSAVDWRLVFQQAP